jgi:hypothetical protein
MNSLPNIHDLERRHGITWPELVELEPKLAQLLCESQRASANCRGWSDVDRIFAPIRNSLAESVGFAGIRHQHPVLGSLAAYEVAYWKLYVAVAGSLPGSCDRAPDAVREAQAGKVAPECSSASAV